MAPSSSSWCDSKETTWRKSEIHKDFRLSVSCRFAVFATLLIQFDGLVKQLDVVCSSAPYLVLTTLLFPAMMGFFPPSSSNSSVDVNLAI